MPNEFKVKNGLLVSGSANINSSGSEVFSVDGTSGRLFQVDDSLSGSLFSVNTAAGLPVIEAFSDNTVRIGQFGQRALFISQSRIGIGKETGLNAILDISGSTIITGSFTVITGSSVEFQVLSTGVIIGTATTDTHIVTGSFNISGSQTLTGSFNLSGSSVRGIPEHMIIALSDESSSVLTTGNSKVVFRAPYAMFLYQIPRSSVSQSSSSGLVTVDINEAGTSILSTKLSIDATEKTSTTAATAAVLSDQNIADDAELTFDIDAAGTGARGLKVTLYYQRV
jgi:hypothetical protein